MKSLSIRHPWAELIISGKKSIEIRTWNTKLRGTFFVHASKHINKNLLERFNLKKENLNFGGVIGLVDLVNVIHYETESQFNKDFNKHLGTWMGLVMVLF